MSILLSEKRQQLATSSVSDKTPDGMRPGRLKVWARCRILGGRHKVLRKWPACRHRSQMFLLVKQSTFWKRIKSVLYNMLPWKIQWNLSFLLMPPYSSRGWWANCRLLWHLQNAQTDSTTTTTPRVTLKMMVMYFSESLSLDPVHTRKQKGTKTITYWFVSFEFCFSASQLKEPTGYSICLVMKLQPQIDSTAFHRNGSLLSFYHL